MAPMKGEGVVWLSGIVVLPDESGREHMLAHFQRRRGLGAVLEEGFVEYDDANEQFKKVASIPANEPIVPTGHPFRVKRDGTEYMYFTAPYPALRVKADRASYLDLASYEGYTCLKPSTRYGGKDKTRTRPRRRRQACLVVEEGHAAAGPQGAGGADHGWQDDARGVSLPPPGRRRRQARSCCTAAHAPGTSTARST